jgi:hypothetical protein
MHRAMTDKLPPSGGRPEDASTRVLWAVLALPGAKVDRKAFLRRQLSKQITSEVLEPAIETSPAKAGDARLLQKRSQPRL